ncbi:MAG: hypothetical protein DLM72_18880 [Candidatus Nitrosopolaris wilkensis]|nr:MAG: hypothetical protein DLM72_18880 [Candidatus Nitrosopolaris wilkensis]
MWVQTQKNTPFLVQSATWIGPSIMAYRNRKENHMILNIKCLGTLILIVPLIDILFDTLGERDLYPE